jgi:hypothetical protein
MMNVSVISVGLAWAVPVKPDTLAWHLEAYEDSFPKLHTLRLCHRYGKGPKAHITKLPLEILRFVEDFVLDKDRRAYEYRFHGNDWEDAFYHFESRCQPIDHADGDPYEIFREADLVLDAVCEDCLSDDTLDDECPKCKDLRTQGMNEMMCDGYIDWRYDRCDNMRVRWREMIDQTANGKFVKYDKVRYSLVGTQPSINANTRHNDFPQPTLLTMC